jgi:hypothetical protein
VSLKKPSEYFKKSVSTVNNLVSGDYVELYAMNNDNDEGLRVIDVNFIVSQIG